MAPRPGTYQAAFNSGELDKRAQGRTDIKQYYQGASYMQRAMPVPQSGFSNEAVLGTKAHGRIRKPQELHAPTVTFFANPAVTPATLLDLTTVKFTVAIGTGDWDIVRLDLGAAQAISCVDCCELAITIATPGRVLYCQTSLDGVAWTNFGPAFAVDVEARSRRWALSPGSSRQARYIRVSMVGLTVAPQFCAIRGVRVWRDGTAAGVYRIRRFSFSRDDFYSFVVTVNNIDVWRNGAWQAAVPIALAAPQVPTLDPVHQLDTMFVLHEDLEPQRIMRQGAHDEWHCWAAPFRRIPQVDLGGIYTNGVPAVFSVQLVNAPIPAAFVLTVAGEDTEAIDVQATTGDTATLIRAKVEALPSVEPGVTVTYDGGRDAFDVSFTGIGNEGDGWSMTGRIVSTGASAIVVSRRQQGKAGGEPLMSAARGWPSCGVIYQQRLVLSGFKAKPNAWLASVSGDYFDYATDIVADTGAYLAAVDTVGSERIERLVFGTFLQFFSSEREYYLTDTALKRNQPPNVRQSTNNGIRRGVPAVATDTTTLFIHKNGGNVVEHVYSDAEQNYVSTNISVLSSSLLKDVSDLALRSAVSVDDASVLYAVNADGSMRAFVMLKSQDVTAAPGRFETDGLVRAVCVTARDEVQIGVDRAITGGTVQVFEELSSEVPLDCWVRVQPPEPATLISHPDIAAFHEGATVWAIADGAETGPFVVAGGAITLHEPASDVYVGRWTPTTVTTLPVPKDVGERTIVDRPVRPTAVRAYVLSTSSIAIGSETDGPFDIELVDYGDPADRLLLANPVSKRIAIEGLAGYSDEGKVTLTQVKPGRLAVREITVETER